MHRVTIERNSSDDGYTKYAAGDDDPDGLAIGGTIGCIVNETVPRPLLCLARAIYISKEFGSPEMLLEEVALVEAASACVEAWIKADPVSYAHLQ